MLQKTIVINSSRLVFTDQQFCTSVSGSGFKMKNSPLKMKRRKVKKWQIEEQTQVKHTKAS